MSDNRTMTLDEIEDLSFRALVAAGTSPENARPLAIATAATEADGVASHGLAYIPIYAEHVQCGKVDGQAKPIMDNMSRSEKTPTSLSFSATSKHATCIPANFSIAIQKACS